eukprot:231617_1
MDVYYDDTQKLTFRQYIGRRALAHWLVQEQHRIKREHVVHQEAQRPHTTLPNHYNTCNYRLWRRDTQIISLMDSTDDEMDAQAKPTHRRNYNTKSRPYSSRRQRNVRRSKRLMNKNKEEDDVTIIARRMATRSV